jgi:hypothetical protein
MDVSNTTDTTRTGRIGMGPFPESSFPQEHHAARQVVGGGRRVPFQQPNRVRGRGGAAAITARQAQAMPLTGPAVVTRRAAEPKAGLTPSAC